MLRLRVFHLGRRSCLVLLNTVLYMNLKIKKTPLTAHVHPIQDGDLVAVILVWKSIFLIISETN